MRAALIVNGKAGTLSSLADPRSDLEAALASAGFDLVRMPRGETCLEAQWEAAVEANVQLFFVAGGDGTLRDAAARLWRSGAILAVLPGGTMNRLCGRLGLPNDPVEAALRYRSGQEGLLDLATASGQVFLYQCIVGAPTRLMRFREMQRGAGVKGWYRLLRAALREVARPASRSLAMRIGPGKRKRGHAAVITMPVADTGAGLEINLARPPGMVARLRQAVRWFRGNLAADTDIITHERAALALHGPPGFLRMSLDGEQQLSSSPLRLRLHRSALRVLLPRAE